MAYPRSGNYVLVPVEPPKEFALPANAQGPGWTDRQRELLCRRCGGWLSSHTYSEDHNFAPVREVERWEYQPVTA